MSGKRLHLAIFVVIAVGFIVSGSGNAWASSGDWTTAEIIGSDPASGAKDVPIDGVVKIYFNEHVEITNYNTQVPRDILEYTVYIERNGKRYMEVPFSMDWDFSNITASDATPVIIGPEKGSAFKWNTTYVIYFSQGTIVPASMYDSVTGITRYYNLSNPVNYSIRFTTKPGLIPVATMPVAGAADISPNASIGVTFNQAIARGDKFGSIVLKYAVDTPDPALRGRQVQADLSIAGDRLVITPGGSLNHSAKYQIVVPEDGVKTADGTISLPWPVDFTFTVEPPAATSAPTPKSGPPAGIVAAIAALAIGAAALYRRR